jgi:FixJ family two-component response regulator
MDISIKTVEVHRARVMRKLEANSVAELVRFHIHNAPPAPVEDNERA